jgi:ribosome maturation factor RimP
MLDRMDGTMITLEDCEKVSSYLSVLLDAQDIIRIRYTLEASSPGLNRPLTTHEDFVNYKGKEIKLLLKLMVEGRRNMVGKLVEVDEKRIKVFVKELEQNIDIAFDNIMEASLQYNFDKPTKRRK